LARSLDVELSRAPLDQFAQIAGQNPEPAIVAMRRKAHHMPTLVRYAAYYRSVASLSGDALASYRAAAQRVGPASSHPQIVGSAQSDGIVAGPVLNTLLNAIQPAAANVLRRGDLWPVE
jgi:hypothetical protein